MTDDSLVTTIVRLLVFVASLSVLILVHEWGHFWVARQCGVGVREFALGFGPALASWRSKSSGTVYRLNLFPLGGYCAMIGEDGHEAAPGDVPVQGCAFTAIGPWRRLAIVAAGPLVNLMCAFMIIWFGAMIVGTNHGESTRVGHLVAGDPAIKAGLQTGDTIVAIDGQTIRDGNAMVTRINSSLGRTLTITYLRHAHSTTVKITPIALEHGGKQIGVIGFMPMPTYERLGVIEAFDSTRIELGSMISATFSGFGDLLRGRREAQSEVSGPIGIARAAISVQEYGVQMYLQFVALLSLSLGIFNLIPFPALDGGRGLFILFELLRGRPVDPEREAMVHLTGFAAIILLVLVVSYHDILNIGAGQAAF